LIGAFSAADRADAKMSHSKQVLLSTQAHVDTLSLLVSSRAHNCFHTVSNT
jgi:hypothetical protein